MTGPSNKPASMILSLQIQDAYGRVIKDIYRLKSGQNRFTCLATYTDGSTDRFSAYWLCPMALPRGGLDFTGALGAERMYEVIVNAAPNHIKYTELTCWVKFPESPNTDAGQYPNTGISFDYSGLDND